MPVIAAEPIQAQIYRLSYMVCQGVIENVTITPDGLYTVYYVKCGKLVNATGKIINVIKNNRCPENSYILFDYSLDSSSRRERILFYQIQLIKDVTPNDAYNIALKHGFEGTEEEWLASLKGGDGKTAYDLAVDAGYEGTVEEWLLSLNGDPGKSAYEIAVAYGFSGTEEEWLKSLEGKPGKTAYEVAVESGFQGSQDEWLASLKGDQGPSAYDIAVEHGFEGTEEDWLIKIGDTTALQKQVNLIQDHIQWVDGMEKEEESTEP